MIELKNISKIYKKQNQQLFALKKINLQIKNNEFVVIKGASGSGKTTLLQILGGMLKPNEGEYLFKHENVYMFIQKKISQFRQQNISFIFQTFHLIPYLNIYENILLGKESATLKESKEQIYAILQSLELENRIDHKPGELSTGECQRVAVGRAIFGEKKLLLADEPTGNLDPENEEKVLQSFCKFHENGGTVVTVTHGNFAEEYASRIIRLNSGEIIQT